MRVLIIGGNGFIGSSLTEKLVAEGQTVRVYDRARHHHSPVENVEYIYGDFQDQSALKSALRDIDIVYHLVCSTVPSTSNYAPVEDINSNLVATVNFLQLCVDASVRKVIFPSSGGTVYGAPQQVPIPESHPTEPMCSYGITKLAIEKYLSLFHQLYGLDYTILRVSNPYGIGQNPQKKVGAVTIFLYRILKQIPIQIWGDGSIIRDYVHISDVTQSFYVAQNAQNVEKLFNIGSGQGTSLNELINTIRGVVEFDFNVEYLESRGFDVPANVLDISKARNSLNWHPMMPLKQGIDQTWKFLKEQYVED
jgi:UDP-glucose 4-epimerase